MAVTKAVRRASQPGASTQGARTVRGTDTKMTQGDRGSPRERITPQNSGTQTEMAGKKRDRERETRRAVRQEEVKRNRERRESKRD